MKRNKIILLLLSAIILIFSSYMYFQRASTTSFVDEYDNIVAAYFMTQGKTLFRDVYHNRQLGMVYISFSIQKTLNPQDLYHLILYHRLFIIFVSAVFGLILILRFGFPALFAVFLFELIKYHSFGNLFQGESLIVYPILYLAGLVIKRSEGKIGTIDAALTVFFTYVIIFARETYIPLVLAMFTLIFFRMKVKTKIISTFALIFLSLVTILTVPAKDYIYNLTYANINPIFAGEINLLKSLFYPIYMFIEGTFTYTRVVGILLSLAFLISLIYTRNFLLVILLAFVSIRYVAPGTELFSAYKMLIWYALISFATVLSINNKNKLFIVPFLFAALVYAVMSPQSIIWQKVDKLKEFDIGYNRYFVHGEEIKRFARSGDTLFVDGYESLLFWQAKLPSSYKYTLYYPTAKNINKYSEERINMFKENPPTFYFRDCLDPYKLYLPEFARADYIRLKINNKDSCLYMRKSY